MGPPTTPLRSSSAPLSWRRWPLAALGPLALAGILSQVDRPALLEALGGADPLLLVLAYSTPLPAIGIRVVRWRLLLGEAGSAWSFRELLILYTRAIALGALTPGRVGELVKAAPLASRGIGLPRAIRSVVVDRLWDVGCLAVLAVFALPVFGIRLASAETRWIGAALAIVAVAGGAFVGAGGVGRLRRWLPALADEAPGLARRVGLACAGLTAVAWAITLAASWFYAVALGMPIGYAEMLVLAALCSLVASLPISIAGAGTRDATLLLVLTPLGIARPETLALSMLMLSNTLFVGAVCALAFLAHPIGPRDRT